MFLLNLIKNLLFFSGSYSNNVFPSPLNHKEEKEEIDKMLAGDMNARNKLIEHNLRLVAHIVKKFEGKEYDTDDLISIGTIGLIKGVDSYNKDKATRITTYVARCVENEILMYFRSNKKNNNTLSLNDSIGYDKDGNEINLIDMIKDGGLDIPDVLHTQNNIELLNQYLKNLNPREQEIIKKRYGLELRKEQTQKEIAKELGISRSYVSRIEKRAITKILKEFIKSKNDRL